MEKVLIAIEIIAIVNYTLNSYKNYKANNEEAAVAWFCAALMTFLLLINL